MYMYLYLYLFLYHNWTLLGAPPIIEFPAERERAALICLAAICCQHLGVCALSILHCALRKLSIFQPCSLHSLVHFSKVFYGALFSVQ